MGEHQLPGAGLGRVLRRLPCGQVQVSWQIGAVEEGGLAQQQVGSAGEPDQRLRLAGIGGIGDAPPPVLEPVAKRFDRVVHVRGGHLERADLPGPRRQGDAQRRSLFL